MRIVASLVLGTVFVSLAFPVAAQPAAVQPPAVAMSKANPELALIRETATAFEAAFNSGNAAEVAALWTEDGEFANESGQSFKGRKAIQDEYEKILAAAKGEKIKIAIDSLELQSETSATEQGRATLDPPPAGALAFGSYTAVHTKVNGKWLMSKVVDARVELPSSYNRISDLEWLIGTWEAEEFGSKTVSVCSWVANKSFVQRTYTVTHPDQTSTSGVQMIGFNPQGGHLQSWNFSPDGGYAVGTWWPRENGWRADMNGTMVGGQSSTATVLLTRLDDNAYVWQSINRSINGQSLPDTDEVVLKRQSN